MKALMLLGWSTLGLGCVDFNLKCTPNVTNPQGLAGYLGSTSSGNPVSLDKVTVRSGDHPIGELLTEAYYHSFDSLVSDTSKLPALAVENSGSIRTECRQTLSAGDVLRGWLRQIVPFDDAEYVFPVTFAEIKGAFEHSVAAFPASGKPPNLSPFGGFLQVFGAGIDVDCAKQPEIRDSAGNVVTPGQRIQKVHIKPRTDPTSKTDLCVLDFSGGVTTCAGGQMWIVANDYLYGGGDGYGVFAEVQSDPTRSAAKLDEGITNFTSAAAYWAATYPDAFKAFPGDPQIRYGFTNCSLP
jgi:hypothetical protein